MLEQAQLRFFLGLEGLRIVQHLAVAIAQDVGGVPAGEAEHACLERRREHALHHRLARLEVLAADRHVPLLGELLHHGEVDGQVGRAIGEWNALHERRIGINHRWRDRLFVLLHRLLERGE